MGEGVGEGVGLGIGVTVETGFAVREKDCCSGIEGAAAVFSGMAVVASRLTSAVCVAAATEEACFLSEQAVATRR